MAGNLPKSGVALVAENAGQFLSTMRGAESSLGAFGKGASGMSNIVTGAFRQVGALITNMAAQAAQAVGQWVAGSVSAAGDFEQTLNVLQVSAKATGEEMAQVAQRAKELGADLELPATSAQDAANVMLELSRAGFSVQQSMDAAKGALQLSAAAQVDAATAAQIIAGALNAFGLEASDATRITDLLAGAANASQASMTDLAQGLGQAGFAFNAAKMPVEDLATSLAVLTKNNLTGSDSGTALKNAIMRLMDPTDKAAGLMEELGFSAYDVNGRMKPLPTIIGDLNRALAGMTDEQRNAALGNIFLSDGMKAMIPLLDLGEDGFLALKEQVTAEGQAAELAAAQTKGWNGALAGFQSQMETLQLTIGQHLLPLLTPLAQQAAAVVGQLTAFAEAAFASGDPLMFLVAAIDGVLPGFAGMLTAIQSVITVLMGELPAGAFTAKSALQAIQQVLVGVVIPAITLAATWLAQNLPAAIATAKAAFSDLQAFVQSVMPIIQSIVTLAIQVMGTFWQNHGADIQTIAIGAYTAIKGFIEIVLAAIQGTLAIALGLMTGDWQTQMGTIRSSNETIWNGISSFFDGILGIIAGFFGTSLTEIANTWDSNFRKMGELATLLMGMAARFITEKVNEIKEVIGRVVGAAVGIWNGLFGDMGATVDSVMNSAASIVSAKVSAIAGAFSGIKSAIDGVISKVKSLIDWLSKISVPDILTPGSPTPFEMGLRGVRKEAARAAVTFQNQFNPALASIPALQLPPSVGASNTTNYGPSYTMPVYTNQSPAVLSQSLALVEVLAS